MTKGYNILDVVKDVIIGDLEIASDDIVESRRALCESCEVRNATFNICTVCGCFIPAKTKLKESECPMELW
jgi:hypothetical protein